MREGVRMERAGTNSATYEDVRRDLDKLDDEVHGLKGSLSLVQSDVSGVKVDVASISASQTEQRAMLKEIAAKLDETRDKRPNWIGWVGVIMLVGTTALTPAYWLIFENRGEMDVVKSTRWKPQDDDRRMAQHAEIHRLEQELFQSLERRLDRIEQSQ